MSDPIEEGRRMHAEAVSKPLPVTEENLRAYLRGRIRGIENVYGFTPETRLADIDSLDRIRYAEYRTLLALAAAFGIEAGK